MKGHAGEFQEVEYLMVDPAPATRARAMKEGGGLVRKKQGMILEREGEEEPPLTPEKQAAMKKASATESQQEGKPGGRGKPGWRHFTASSWKTSKGICCRS